MDTATYIVMGVGLTALATQDPVMAGSFAATATTLVAGSLIPDGDTVLKLKIMRPIFLIIEELPIPYLSLFLWPILITFLIFVIFNNTNPLHVWLWAQLAVFYMFVDIFNSYGTQALRPITNKWIQLSVISTFDPIIFTLLCIGVLLLGFRHTSVFRILPIVAILVIYYVIRFMMQSSIKRSVNSN